MDRRTMQAPAAGYGGRRMVRQALAGLGALAVLVSTGGPATAHSVSGQEASNFRTRLTAVTPSVPGIEVEVIENGSRVQVTNRTGDELFVLGYQDEPYLRVGSDGVFENRRSPATYLNQDRRGGVVVPDHADGDAEPEWEQVSPDPVARWHDHRIHWMADRDPPAVRAEPGRRHVVIPDWVIPMEHAGTTIEATGDLIWVPGPNPWPWLAGAAALLLLALAVIRLPRWPVGLALLLGVLVGTDVVHAVGVSFSTEDGAIGARLGETLAGSYASVAGWIAGLVGLGLVATGRRRGALQAAALAGAFVAANGGVADIGHLSHSSVPFAWSPSIVRAAIATSLGIGLGIVAGSGLRLVGGDDSEPS